MKKLFLILMVLVIEVGGFSLVCAKETDTAGLPQESGLLSQICVLRDFRSKRASSWDRSGGNADCLIVPAG